MNPVCPEHHIALLLGQKAKFMKQDLIAVRMKFSEIKLELEQAEADYAAADREAEVAMASVIRNSAPSLCPPKNPPFDKEGTCPRCCATQSVVFPPGTTAGFCVSCGAEFDLETGREL